MNHTESGIENLSREKILEVLELWGDTGILPLQVTRHGEIYGAGTLKFIYDSKKNIINVKGLRYQNFEYTGSLDNFLNKYKLWLR